MHDEHSVRAVLMVLGLLVVAAVGSGKALGGSRILSIRLVARTGILFLLLGAVIGPSGFGLIDPEVLKQLGAIVVIGLGWIGFLYGIQLEYKSLRRFDPRLFWTALGEAGFTFLFVALAFGGIAFFWLGRADVAALLILASAAAGTAPAPLFILRSELPRRGPTYELLRFCASLDDLPGLIALGVLFSIYHGEQLESAALTTLLWFVFQVALGLFAGWLTHHLHEVVTTAQGGDPEASTLAFFGMVGLTSGFASYLGLSPLFVNAVAGITFANVSHHSERVYSGLARREHTVYVLFLLVAGCYWPFPGFRAFDVLLLYMVTRAVGKIAGTYFASKAFLAPIQPMREIPPHVGMGLLPQGGLAIAMIVSYLWEFGNTAQSWAINLVHLSVILNELASPYLLFRTLKGDR